MVLLVAWCVSGALMLGSEWAGRAWVRDVLTACWGFCCGALIAVAIAECIQ